MEEYVCIEVQSREGESRESFSARLSDFWTQMLRRHEEQFEKVFAEAAEFEGGQSQWSRRYLAEESVVEFLVLQLRAAGLTPAPIDPHDTYSKYEAVAPDWMQIEH